MSAPTLPARNDNNVDFTWDLENIFLSVEEIFDVLAGLVDPLQALLDAR